MAFGLTDRRLIVEQQLFDVSARLERALGELEIAEEKVRLAEAAAEEARARTSASETPLAHRELYAARLRRDQVGANALAVREQVRLLEVSRDDLIAKLLG